MINNIITSKEFILLVILIIFLGFIIGYIKRAKKFRLIRKTPLAKIDKMSGTDFEHYLCTLYSCRGYSVQHMGKSGDFGCDLLVKKNGVITAVQAKRYSSKVGVKAVQEIYGARTFYNANKATVVTNSYYTNAAKTLASKLGVALVDRSGLVEFINELK